MRLLEPICSFTERPGYTVFKSEMFPHYYAANGIQIHLPQERSLAEWEQISNTFFDPHIFEHITYTFPKEDGFKQLIEEATEAGYHVTTESYMFVNNLLHCKEMPANFEVRKIESAQDWKRLRKFYNDFSKDYDWYDDEAGSDTLFEKTRFISEAVGMEWFYLTERGSDEIMSKLGIFQHNGICNLQDVGTSREHRRKGLAAYLVSFAIKHAIQTLGTEGLALCADADYYAVKLYSNLGFREVGQAVTLMKYPVKNPDATA